MSLCSWQRRTEVTIQGPECEESVAEKGGFDGDRCNVGDYSLDGKLSLSWEEHGENVKSPGYRLG